MPVFRIPVFWSYGGTLDIEAENLDEAILVAQDSTPMQLQGLAEYIDGSWTVDIEGAKDMNDDQT